MQTCTVLIQKPRIYLTAVFQITYTEYSNLPQVGMVRNQSREREVYSGSRLLPTKENMQ